MGMIPHITEQTTPPANSPATSSAEKKSRLILTRKNQKGQVAIFVALIFQVVFVFFALMINVGLLVHQKINLQHSTDLAAYYGAMKQAEQLNAISHINFQMRQAWKLWTWRYRILGTFGFIKGSGGDPQDFAFESVPNQTFIWNGTRGIQAQPSEPYKNGTPSNPALNCASHASDSDYLVDGAPVGIQDVPFFCVNHSGFTGWPQSENNCQLNCDMFKSARVINLVPSLTSTYTTPFGGNLANSVNDTIDKVNTDVRTKCQKLGPFGATMFARFMAAFANESIARSETIKMLAANLSQDADTFVDIEGESIKAGSKRTFENNLTGANFTGLNQTDSFKVFNGLSTGECRFGDGGGQKKEWLKRIEFKFINYFIQMCETVGGPGNGSVNYHPDSVYHADGSLSPAFDSTVDQSLKNVVLSFLNAQNLATIGYEKNPNCIDYYAVKTYSEPMIPFLPFAKIKLEAVAVAKPFGGTIGPWYGTTWPYDDYRSKAEDLDAKTKMDGTLPMRDFQGASNAPLTQSVYTQPNFALFVGDKLGLRNLDYIATFHSMLGMRDINDYPGTNSSAARNSTKSMGNTSAWPNYVNWSEADDASIDFRKWDSLATDQQDPKTGQSQAGMRAVEIAAIAPNQFDIFHYSIDPDFYNNYYVKLYKGFDKIKSAAGNSVSINKDQLRPDFGARDVDGTVEHSAPMSLKTFSVKDQILLKNIVLDTKPEMFGVGSSSVPPAGAGGTTYNDFLNVLVSLQSSLLTGWTFLNYNHYTDMPGAFSSLDRLQNNMAFGQCDDTWNKTTAALNAKKDPQNFETPLSISDSLPPAVGNCVTGGRTGYSVKIISPTMINGTDNDLPKILNPIDPTFFQF